MHHSGKLSRGHPLRVFTMRLNFLSGENQEWIIERAIAE
jgi:hypothetical protein